MVFRIGKIQQTTSNYIYSPNSLIPRVVYMPIEITHRVFMMSLCIPEEAAFQDPSPATPLLTIGFYNKFSPRSKAETSRILLYSWSHNIRQTADLDLAGIENSRGE